MNLLVQGLSGGSGPRSTTPALPTALRAAAVLVRRRSLRLVAEFNLQELAFTPNRHIAEITDERLAALAQNTSGPWRSPYTYQGDKAMAIAAPIEISLGYGYLRANHGPGQCGCFNMNGGTADIASISIGDSVRSLTSPENTPPASTAVLRDCH